MLTFEDRQKKQTTNNVPTCTLQRKPTPEHVGGFVDNRPKPVIQRMENNTGLPDSLKQGVENLSGMDISDVRVFRNSSKPASLNAHAYTQGTNIHVAPGQERHLPHEAWHVVQQKQGRVKPTIQTKGNVNINNDSRLEREADAAQSKVMAVMQRQSRPTLWNSTAVPSIHTMGNNAQSVVQCVSHGAPTQANAADFDSNRPDYLGSGIFATIAAIVATTSANNNTASAPTSPTNAARIEGGVGQEEDYKKGAGPAHNWLGYTPANASSVTIEGGKSAGAAGNQLTKIHIIHHGLGVGTNRNPANIFWGNPGFNNPQILVEETLMLNHLKHGGQSNVFSPSITMVNDYFGTNGDNEVVPYLGNWYAKSNAKLIAKTGGNISGATLTTVNSGFGNPPPGVNYQKVDTTKVPHVGTYEMDVNYGQNGMSSINMYTKLNTAVNKEYKNRPNAKWQNEDDSLVQIELSEIVNEAVQSISRSVTITQEQYEMKWQPTPPATAGPINAIPITRAAPWITSNRLQNTVTDSSIPRFSVEMEYLDTAGATKTSTKKLYDWA